MLLWLTPAAMRGSRLSLFRSLALLVPLLVLFSAASAAAKAGLAVTTQQQVRVGEAIKFQWHGGTPPYTLKVIVNNKVVSQNEGWTGNSVQWRSTPEQIPIGSEIKIRLSDSEGQMVLSDVTKVVGDSNDSQNYDDDDEKRPIWHQGMDDPHSGDTKDRKTFGLEFGIGPGGMTLGVNRGPATTTAAAEASPIGTEEPQPTGVPDWEASEVAGDTLLPQTGASSISDLATLTSDGASSANATSTATTAAVTADATNSVAIDSTVAGMSATDDASAAASSSTSTSDTETKEESANADLYIGIAVIVLLAVVGLGGRHRKQAEADSAASKKRGGSSMRSGHGSASSGDDDEEKLVGQTKGDDYGSSEDEMASASRTKAKGESAGGRRGSSAYRDDRSDAYSSDGDVTPKSGRSPRRSRA